MKVVALALLIVAGLVGCGGNDVNKKLEADLANLRVELTAVRAEVAALRVPPPAKAIPAAPEKPQAMKVRLHERINTDLSDSADEIRKRLGIAKADRYFVVPAADGQTSPLEWDIRELQKIVDTLAKTAVLIEPESIELVRQQ